MNPLWWMDSLSLAALTRLNYWSQIATIVLTVGLVLSAILTFTSATRITQRRDKADEDARQQRAAAEESLRSGLESSQAAAESARREAAELRRRMQPRQLAADQRDELIGRLARGRGTLILVFATVGDAERFDYAMQLAESLSAAGWKLGAPVGQFMDATTGVRIRVRDAGQPNSGGKILAAALASVGVAARLESLGPNADPEVVHLVVGGRE